MSTDLRRRLGELWRLGWRHHLLYSSCTFLGLLVLFAMGPSLQTYLASVVASRAPSIYDMAYDNGITDFPGFWTWLIGDIAWTTVIQAAIVTAAIMLAQNRRGAFSYAIVGSFVALFGTDLLLAASGSPVDLTAGFVCDVIGSILLGGLVVAALCAVSAMERTTAVVPALRKIAAPGLIIVGALMCSAVTFLIVFFIYQPLEDRFELSVQAPASGAMIVDGRMGSEIASKRLFVTGSEHGADVEIKTIREGKNRSRLFWNAHIGNTADIRVSVIDGCFLYDLKTFVPDLTFKKVHSIALWSNAEESYWNIPKAKVRDVSMSTGGEVAFFWLEKSKAERNVELSFFGRKSDVAGSTAGGFRSYLTNVSFDRKAKGYSVADHRFTLVVDGRQVTMISKGLADAKRNDYLSCKRAGLRDTGITDRYEFKRGAGVVSGVALTLLGPEAEAIGNFSIGRINGQSSFSGMDPKSWGERELGGVSMVAVGGRISEARVADADVRVTSIDRIEGAGDVKARSIRDGFLIRGKMRTLWKNQQRLLQTRWERLGSEIQVWVLGIFGVIFGWLILRGLPLLRGVSYDEQTPWSP